MEVWTYGFFPFTLEGSVNKPIKCDLPATGPFELGAGQQGYLITDPNGGTHVAEATTGVLIGRTVEQVRADFDIADPQIIELRLGQLKAILADALLLTPDEFWSIQNIKQR